MGRWAVKSGVAPDRLSAHLFFPRGSNPASCLQALKGGQEAKAAQRTLDDMWSLHHRQPIAKYGSKRALKAILGMAGEEAATCLSVPSTAQVCATVRRSVPNPTSCNHVNLFLPSPPPPPPPIFFEGCCTSS